MDTAIVITGEENIRKAQYATIQAGLNLQTRTGLKHSHNAPVIAARNILAKAGIVPKRTIKALLQQFYKHRLTIDPQALAPRL